MSDVATSHILTIREALDLAAVAIKRGDVALGQKRLEWVLERDPECGLAWLWMTKCVSTAEKKIDCYRRVLAIDPENPHAVQGLRQLEAPVASTPANLESAPQAPAAPTPQRAGTRAPHSSGSAPVAGQSTRRMARSRKNRTILYALAGLAGIALLGITIQNGSALGSGGILVLYAILLVLPRVLEKGVDRRMRRVEDAERGARGEEVVAQILESLGEGYQVLHDVPSPYGNIDHIVISRHAGIFLLETKAHGGKVDVVEGRLMVNRRPPEKDFIAQVLKNTYWLRLGVGKVLGEEPWVSAILVFANAFVPRLAPIKGVRIINKKYLLEAVQSGGRGSPVNARLWEKRAEIEAQLDAAR